MNRAYAVLEIKAVDEAKRTFRGIATTPATDRVGDIVEPKGALFKLPIPLLWQHRPDDPIGWVTSAKVTAAGIEVEGEIADYQEDGELKQRLLKAWQMLKAKLVRGLSIGFNSIESARIDGTYGIRFLTWEWLELSAVTIPANQEATITAIKSIDDELLAASGRAQILPSAKTHTPGASGNKMAALRGQKSTLSTGANMKTIQEQIAEFEAKRKSIADRMALTMNKAAEEGRTLDEAEIEEYDGLDVDLKSVDAHIKRLKVHEQNMVTKATTIVASPSGEVSREPHVLMLKREVPKGTAFTRYCIALAASKGNVMQAAEFAKRWKDETPEVGNVLVAATQLGTTDFHKSAGESGLQQVLKAAVSAGTTTDSTWAAPLVQYQDMASEFIELLRPETILGKLTGLRQVPFNLRIQRQTAGVAGSFVGEGAPKPVNAMAFDSITMTWAKAAVIVVLSDELVRFSNPSAEALARRDLVAGVAEYLDKRFIDPGYAGVANVSPSSITNGITPVASTGSTLAAITNDVESMFAGFVAANLKLRTGAWVMTPMTALRLSLLRNTNDEFAFPAINMNGGTWFGLPVVTSNSAVAAGSPSEQLIVLLDQEEILVADEGGITIDMSMEASLQMNDAPSGGATSLVSLWQNNLIGLRAERYINWARRRSQAVAVLGNVSY